MYNSLKQLFEDDPLLISFFLACLGGIVRGLRCRASEFTVFGFAYRVIAAGFVGILAAMILANTEINPQVEAALIGACGYSAVDLLQDVPTMIKEGIKKKIDK